MNAYRVNTPKWFKKLHPGNLIWDMPDRGDRSVYLTFDDGPHPEITPFVLDQLRDYQAKATFFCVGNNVHLYPDAYQRILDEGHSVGNHTYDHLNGWRTDANVYTGNIVKASSFIHSPLFRPPYGRIRYSQLRRLHRARPEWKIIMWSILSADFDISITPEQCLDNVLRNIRAGSIVVFHDSIKARERMEYVLPRVLDWCRSQNLIPKAIKMES